MISMLLTDLFPFTISPFVCSRLIPHLLLSRFCILPAAQRPAIPPLAFLPRLARVGGKSARETKKEQKWIRKKKTRKKKYFYDIYEGRHAMPLHNIRTLERLALFYATKSPQGTSRRFDSSFLRLLWAPSFLFDCLDISRQIPFLCHEWNVNTTTGVGVLS